MFHKKEKRVKDKLTWQIVHLQHHERVVVALLVRVRKVVDGKAGMAVVVDRHVALHLRVGARDPHVVVDLQRIGNASGPPFR